MFVSFEVRIVSQIGHEPKEFLSQVRESFQAKAHKKRSVPDSPRETRRLYDFDEIERKRGIERRPS